MKSRALLTNESGSCKEIPMDESSLVIGAGVIGSRVAGMLAERGDRVSVISRRGSGPAEFPGVTRVAADAADAGAMARLAEGAVVVYNCVNPPYHRWPADWPPIAASVLAAAERSGAVLVTLSNLYGYGPRVPGGYNEAHPITEATPLAATGRKGRVRARVWQDALAAHRAGRVRVAEVRAADFVGPGAQSAMGERIVRHVRQGAAQPASGHQRLRPGRGGRSGPRRRDPLGRPARNGARLAAHAGAARDRVPVPRRLRHGLLRRSGHLRPEAGTMGGDRRRHGQFT
jgi:nucleoside-diphosphate-sugar epimerase